MSWRDDIFLLNAARGKKTQQIDTSDPVFNTPSSTPFQYFRQFNTPSSNFSSIGNK